MKNPRTDGGSALSVPTSPATAERRHRVAAFYLDETLPERERSARALGRRFGVSHRTILNDLAAAGVAARLAQAPLASGLPPEEFRRRVAEFYATHTAAEIAAKLGCSKPPVLKAVHALGLSVRPAAPRRKLPRPETRPCLYCGAPFEPTAVQVKDGYGKWCGRECYDAWRSRVQDELAETAAVLYSEGRTIDEIAGELEVGRDRVWRALHRAGATMRRGRRPIHTKGRWVKCRARGHAFCPHGDRERWVYASQSTEFLSLRCWALYRWTYGLGVSRELLRTGRARQRWLGRWGGRAAGKLGGRPQVTLAENHVAEIFRLHALGWGRRAIASRLLVSERAVRNVLEVDRHT